MSNTQFTGSEQELKYLLSTQAIRQCSQKIYELALQGQTHFQIHPDKIPQVAQFVAQVTLENYPQLDIPFHSRWKHFNVGGVDRVAELNQKLVGLSLSDRCQAKLDLVIVSVLLDAGAGMTWSFKEPQNPKPFAKSEGLAVASYHMFCQGLFSSNPKRPYQVDAQGLANLSFEQFQTAFQISPNNPLVGDRGRFELLKSLGRLLTQKPEYFGSAARPGALLLTLATQGKNILATDILTVLQKSLGAIWPGRVLLNDFNLGDVWPYAPLGQGLQGLVPFHKLSQWLTYSMVDPIVESGLMVSGFSDLTALAEYRNGGLLVDGEILSLRNPQDLQQAHKPASELIVEWRALTIVLMEQVATQVRQLLNKNENELPLGKVLEGGTWWAGRRLAAQKRADGGSPLQIESDGTVF